MPGSVLHGQGVRGEVSRGRFQHPYLHPGKFREAGVGGCPGGQQDPASCGGTLPRPEGEERRSPSTPSYPSYNYPSVIHPSLPLRIPEDSWQSWQACPPLPLGQLETARTPIYLCLSLVRGEGLQAEVGVKGTLTFPPRGLATARGLRLAPQVCAPCMAPPRATAHMQLLSTGF